MGSRAAPYFILAGGWVLAVVGAVVKLAAGCNFAVSPGSSASSCAQSAVVDQYGAFHNVIPGNLTYDFLGMALVVLGMAMILVGLTIALLQEAVPFAGPQATSPAAVPAHVVAPPRCPMCGEALVRILEHERWYCLQCKEFR